MYSLSGKGRTGKYLAEVMLLGPSAARSVQMTESQIFSCTAQPNPG